MSWRFGGVNNLFQFITYLKTFAKFILCKFETYSVQGEPRVIGLKYLVCSCLSIDASYFYRYNLAIPSSVCDIAILRLTTVINGKSMTL